MKNYFHILGVFTTTSETELRASYKRRARETHPDSGGQQEDFQEVVAAYEVLSDPVKRREYELGILAFAQSQGHVVCDACYAVNRVRAMRAGQTARCAHCRTELKVTADERKDRYTAALKEQVGDLLLTFGAETGSLAQDAVRAAAEGVRRKLGLGRRK